MTTEAFRMLRKLAEEWGISENQANERAVREAHRELVEERSEDEPERELVVELRDQVEYLRAQLRTRDEEIRRRDHLMAAAIERIPALEGRNEDQETTESDLRASGEVPRGTGRAENERKAWWQLWRS